MKIGNHKSAIIAVFGGTFDPPHKGHISLAEEILSSKAADSVIFVPAFKPPHKPDSPVSGFRKRLDMLELATKKNKGFSVSDIEGGRPGPSFTYDTLDEISKLHTDSEIKLLLGSDSLVQLHTWYRAKELVQKWHLIVYPRKGTVPAWQELCLNWGREVAEKLLGYILPVPFHDFSSTEIRDKIMKGEDVKDLLDPDVFRYVMKNGLYNRK